MTLLERLPQETDRSYALRNIKENIINLDLAPGSQISENELAAQMGLSRTPVREAITELSRVQIIKVVPQKKSTVAMIDYDMVEQARFMRHTLEYAVVELACEMITPEGLFRLEENLQLQQFYLQGRYYDKFLALDNQFHRTLFIIAQKSQVYDITENLSIHFDRVRRMSLDSVTDSKLIEDHTRIFNAIKNRDAAEARRITQIHLARYKLDAEAIRGKYPQYFEK